MYTYFSFVITYNVYKWTIFGIYENKNTQILIKIEKEIITPPSRIFVWYYYKQLVQKILYLGHKWRMGGSRDPHVNILGNQDIAVNPDIVDNQDILDNQEILDDQDNLYFVDNQEILAIQTLYKIRHSRQSRHFRLSRQWIQSWFCRKYGQCRQSRFLVHLDIVDIPDIVDNPDNV